MRVPMLNRRHKRQRLAYARRYVHASQSQWSNVLFTNDSRFYLHGNDRWIQVWRCRGGCHNPNHTMPVIAFHGGSIMVWPEVSRYLRTLVIFPRGGLTVVRYVDEILRPVVLPLRQRRGNHFLLMQDNARPHVARHMQQFLPNNQIRILEHVWDILGSRLQHEYPTLAKLRELAHALRQIWQRIPQDVIRRCTNMHNRLTEVIQQRGGNTPY